MTDLSPTAYVVLGMLRLGSQTGYDIKRAVDASTRFFWAASHAQIYPELKRLAKAGMVSGSEEPTGGRRRIVYRLEPSGEAALRDWLAADDDLTIEYRDLGLLKLFFADALDFRQRSELVQRMRTTHERLLEKLKESEAGARELERAGQALPLTTLQFGVEFFEWAIDWCKRLESRLARDGGG